MKLLLVDNNSKSINSLQQQLVHIGLKVTVLKKNSFSEEMTQGYDVVIFSGGSKVRSVKNHPEDYQTQIDFVKSTDKKVIGICLGCEIVAVAFGCSLGELQKAKKGVTEIILRNQEKIRVYESHRFIVEKISDSIEVLAYSEHGVEALRHKSKPIYGLQFHPEMFIDQTQGKDIFLEILNVKGRL